MELKKQANIETSSLIVEFKLFKRDKEDHFIFIKGKTNAKNIIILNKNTLNTCATNITVRTKTTE